MEKQDHTKIMEWTVWVNLDKKKDLELILLRGHLILEAFMDNLFKNGSQEKYKKLNFFGKVNLLNKVTGSDLVDIESIKTHLLSINNIRNKFAHEWSFNIHESEIEKWSKDVLFTFEGEKFSKYTYRTKVIHAFSSLSGALVEIQQEL